MAAHGALRGDLLGAVDPRLVARPLPERGHGPRGGDGGRTQLVMFGVSAAAREAGGCSRSAASALPCWPGGSTFLAAAGLGRLPGELSRPRDSRRVAAGIGFALPCRERGRTSPAPVSQRADRAGGTRDAGRLRDPGPSRPADRGSARRRLRTEVPSGSRLWSPSPAPSTSDPLEARSSPAQAWRPAALQANLPSERSASVRDLNWAARGLGDPATGVDVPDIRYLAVLDHEHPVVELDACTSVVWERWPASRRLGWRSALARHDCMFLVEPRDEKLRMTHDEAEAPTARTQRLSGKSL